MHWVDRRQRDRKTSRQTQSQGEPTMSAATLQAAPQMAMPVRKTVSRSSADSEFRAGTKGVMGRSERSATQSSSLSCALDLSGSRAHDAVLEILRAYKLRVFRESS